MSAKPTDKSTNNRSTEHNNDNKNEDDNNANSSGFLYNVNHARRQEIVDTIARSNAELKRFNERCKTTLRANNAQPSRLGGTADYNTARNAFVKSLQPRNTFVIPEQTSLPGTRLGSANQQNSGANTIDDIRAKRLAKFDK